MSIKQNAHFLKKLYKVNIIQKALLFSAFEEGAFVLLYILLVFIPQHGKRGYLDEKLKFSLILFLFILFFIFVQGLMSYFLNKEKGENTKKIERKLNAGILLIIFSTLFFLVSIFVSIQSLY